ncbi:RNA recognition motif domain - like 1 [Theobroma cacao]|nr:RNA recognition motif domain - like 1 [Theobroma cacao]
MAYIDNLNPNVSWNDDKEFFNEYGIVVDLFIESIKIAPRERKSEYAFVKYRYEKEIWGVTKQGNLKRWGDRIIRVKKVKYGWKERRKSKEEQQNLIHQPREIVQLRSSKEVLAPKMRQGNQRRMLEKNNDDDKIQLIKMGLDISYRVIQSRSLSHDIPTKIRPIGEKKVVTILEDEGETDIVLELYLEILDEWFESVVKYRDS